MVFKFNTAEVSTMNRGEIIEDIEKCIGNLSEQSQILIYSSFVGKYKNIRPISNNNDPRVIISSRELKDHQLYELHKNLKHYG